MSMFSSDIRFAARTFVRQPRLSLVAILSLAIAIGATTTIFAIISGILFRPLPYPNADAIVAVRMDNTRRSISNAGPSLLELSDLAQRAKSLSALAAFNEEEFNVGAEQPLRVTGAAVSASLFPLLGVQPRIGRPFTPAEDATGAQKVVLLGHNLWETHFRGDSSIMGQQARINGVAHDIVGVMPPDFGFPETSEIWIPLYQYVGEPRSRRDRGWDVYAHLENGIDVGAANAEVASIGRALAAEHKDTNADWSMEIVPLAQTRGEDAMPVFIVLMSAVVFVLLIACGNLAGLLLARGVARKGELAIRAALGASRTRLVAQLLTESALLATAGGLLGTIFAIWGVRLATIALESQRMPFWMSFELDWRVLLFALGTSLATGLLFGSIPALRLSAVNLREGTGAAARGASGPRRRKRLMGVIVAAELALALVLLTGAGVMLGTLARVSSADVGYDFRGLFTGIVDPLESRYNEREQRRLFHDRVIEELAAIPGVESAAAFYPVFGRVFETDKEPGRAGEHPSFPEYRVTPAYFRALKAPLRSGREFTAMDAEGAAPVGIVNQELARQLWPGEEPLGKRLRVRDTVNAQPWISVVGVVGNVRRNPTDPEIEPHLYRPFAQEPPRRMHLVLRTTVPPLSITRAAEAAVRRADPDQPLTRVMTMEQQIADWFGPARFFGYALVAFASFALILACMGIYGVTTQAVEQRTREIGIRLALGATPKNVLLFLVKQNMRLVLTGLVVGLGASFALAQVLMTLPFGVESADPVVIGALALMLATIALAATYLPSHRAVHARPMDALRSE